MWDLTTALDRYYARMNSLSGMTMSAQGASSDKTTPASATAASTNATAAFLANRPVAPVLQVDSFPFSSLKKKSIYESEEIGVRFYTR
uniref:Uncharacterized protein n=1 Tax=Ascaris lumbricoides TaxID=6252 RepID=A0A0M3IXH1_ASCLU